jgi:hypothetical protein
MSSRRRSEGFQPGDVVVAVREAQELEPGVRYAVLRREAHPGRAGMIVYTLQRLHAAPPIEVTNLPLLAQLAEEEMS